MSITTAFELPYPGAVEDDDFYVVRDGDILGEIAERFLGDSSLTPLLTQLNGVTDADLTPGTVLLLHPEYDNT